jgi:hypothetical protein
MKKKITTPKFSRQKSIRLNDVNEAEKDVEGDYGKKYRHDSPPLIRCSHMRIKSSRAMDIDRQLLINFSTD